MNNENNIVPINEDLNVVKYEPENIKNLILHNTIDEYKESRKEKYINEAKMSNYTGNVIVPEDMEEIVI